jgi:hypothetical protein
MSILGCVNFIFLQWLFVRLAREYNDKEELQQWVVLVGVIPLTGWWSDYKYIC